MWGYDNNAQYMNGHLSNEKEAKYMCYKRHCAKKKWP
jgi:hypothetical protein